MGLERAAVVLMIGLLVAGCGDDPSADTPSSATDTTATTAPATRSPTSPTNPTNPSTTTTRPEGTMPSTSPSQPPTGNTAFAVNDLAARLGVDAGEIEIVSVEEVTWPDGSLGCPDKDMAYTQAIVNGQLIVLAVGGTRYEYHSGAGRQPFYCPQGRATRPSGGVYPSN